MVPLRDHTGLPEKTRGELERSLADLRTLEAVVRWGFAQQPAAAVANVVVQDEYTHDVILGWQPERWLVFAST